MLSISILGEGKANSFQLFQLFLFFFSECEIPAYPLYIYITN